VRFEVHNSSYMPDDVQTQVFQRSFSTKGGGRGLGTYSVKLLTQRYLQGRVGFQSDRCEGTTFWVDLPREPALEDSSG
jgi:signal transduction histidine kinase